MSDNREYQPGDIVNGYILGADNHWHPAPSAQTFKPGDISNGHILGADHQWHPLPSGYSPESLAPKASAEPPASIPPSQADETGGEELSTTATDERTESGPNDATPLPASTGTEKQSRKGLVIGSAAAGVGLVALIGAAAGGNPGSTTSASTTSATPTQAAPGKPALQSYWMGQAETVREAFCRDRGAAATTLATNTTADLTSAKLHLETNCPAAPSPTPSMPAPPPPPQPPKEYPLIDERTWQLIAKNPNQYKGQTYLIFGEVTQFDSATGPNTFRADVAQANTCSYGFFLGENTLLTKGPGADLTNVVNDDVFAAKVTVLGSESYSTTLGGATTVPKLQVDSIELQGRCE